MSDLTLFRSSLRDLARPKRLVVAFLMIALPTLLALVFRFGLSADEYDGGAVYNTLSSGVVFGFLLVILSVVFGTGVLAQEIEQKTIVYLLTRPVPRWRIMLVKFLAAITWITVTLWIATVLLALVSYGPAGLGKESTASALSASDISDLPGLVGRLQKADDPLPKLLATQAPDVMTMLQGMDLARVAANTGNGSAGAAAPPAAGILDAAQMEMLRQPIVDALNKLVHSGVVFANAAEMAGASLSEHTVTVSRAATTKAEKGHANRLALHDLYPTYITEVRSPAQLLRWDMVVLPLGAMAYGALFLLLATLLNRPLMYGLIFAFGWESWVPTMPGNFQKVSLMSYLRVLAPHPKLTTDEASFSSLLGVLSPGTITTTLAWEVLIVTTVFALGLALLMFSNNEYVPREDAE